MEKVSSKDIIIIIMGIILAFLFPLILQFSDPDFYEFKTTNLGQLILMMTPAIIGIVVVIYMKINELNKELDNQKLELQKLGEKLKTSERLSKIEAKIGI